MSVTKYCLECRAQVSADETVCPFCGGILTESEPEPSPEEIPEYAPEGLTKSEFMSGYVAPSDRNSIKVWSIGLLIAAVASVLLSGAVIIEPLFIVLFGVCFALSLAAFLLPNAYLASAVTAVSLFTAVYGYIKSRSVVGLFLVIVAFYLAFSLFRLDVKWKNYKKGVQFEKIKQVQGMPAYKPMSNAKKAIVCVIALAAFAGAFTFSFITQTKEFKKYEFYTVGEFNADERKFSNEWVGMSLNVPDGYKVASDEELETINKDKKYTDEKSQWIAFSASKDEKNTVTVMLHDVGTENFEGKDYLEQIEFKNNFDEKNLSGLILGGCEFDAYYYGVNHVYELALNQHKYAVVVKFTADSDESLNAMMHDFLPDAAAFEEATWPEETTAEEETTTAEVSG